jgi:hypothetical protein
MVNHIVIDSIARSGTTLLSALLRSQEGIISFCPGFNEPLSCNKMGEWPHGVCRQDFIKTPDLDFNKFQHESIAQILDFAQYYGLDEDEWKSIILESNNPSEIRKNLENSFPEAQAFCYRWNQTLCYFNEWINNGPNYLWVSMIRHPLDRAHSSLEKHGWTLKDSLDNTVSFATKLQSVANNKQFHLLYYEDLVQDPKNEMKQILDFINVNNRDINLENIKGSNGQDFIPQSSEMSSSLRKADGYFKGKKFDGIYSKQVGRHKKHHNLDTYSQFKKSLERFPQYERYFTNES